VASVERHEKNRALHFLQFSIEVSCPEIIPEHWLQRNLGNVCIPIFAKQEDTLKERCNES
jgi:hypothetical protein